MFSLVTFIPRAIVQSVPLLLGCVGETLNEKSGSLNLGIPGVMYVGGISGVIGAFLVNITKTFISESFPEIWSYFIGAIFVLVVLFLPRGLTGVFTDVMGKVISRIKKSKEVQA